MREKNLYTIRLDTFENVLIHFEAKGDFGGGRALRMLARDSAIPVDEEKIKARVVKKRTVWALMEKDNDG